MTEISTSFLWWKSQSASVSRVQSLFECGNLFWYCPQEVLPVQDYVWFMYDSNWFICQNVVVIQYWDVWFAYSVPMGNAMYCIKILDLRLEHNLFNLLHLWCATDLLSSPLLLFNPDRFVTRLFLVNTVLRQQIFGPSCSQAIM